MLVTRGLIAAGAALCAWSGANTQAQHPAGQRDHLIVRPHGAPGAGFGTIKFVRDNDEAAPSAWIGVRMSPIPAPLAAHVGESGLMVGNIAVGSPAEKAGLQQYDVMLRFNGQSIDEMEDLVSAVQAAGADAAVKVELLRGGKAVTLDITPSTRPSNQPIEFKFAEPDADIQSMQMRGKRLRPGPGGNWLLEDFGQLDLPQGVMQMLPQGFFQHMPAPGAGGHAFQFHLGPGGHGGPGGPGGVNVFRFAPGGGGAGPGAGNPFEFFIGDVDDNGDAQVSISINENGKVLSIQRDADGGYVVEKSENGNKQSATYESEDEFRENDPDAYSRYRQFRRGGRNIISVRPPAGQVQGLQKDFQEQLEQMIRESKQQVEDAEKLLDEARQSQQQKAAPRGEGKVRRRTSNNSQ